MSAPDPRALTRTPCGTSGRVHTLYCDAGPVTLHDYVVDTEGLSADARGEICCLVIRTLEETAARFETDIPWTQATTWPVNVNLAAEVLVRASGSTDTDESYQQTGVMQRDDEAAWQAFATFAGYAFDASVWSDSQGAPFVSLSDEGKAVVVRLNEEALYRLVAAVEPTHVLPLGEFRAPRRRRT